MFTLRGGGEKERGRDKVRLAMQSASHQEIRESGYHVSDPDGCSADAVEL